MANLVIPDGGNIGSASDTDAISISSSGAVTFSQDIYPNNFVGMIAPFAMATPPTGWLVCNGSEYAIASYGELYTAIGTTWGSLTNGSGSAGSTHFKVPDLRGEFLRGLDNGAGNDPDASSRTGGDAVGSSQSYEIQSHTHQIGGTASTSGGFGRNVGTAYQASGATGGNETRPRNKYVQYCIKY